MDEVLIIASALSVQDPRERPMDKQGEADEAHRKFRDESSDFLSYLKVWDFYHDQAKRLSTSKLRKLCQANFLSFVRMREWHDIHSQLRELSGEMGLLREGQEARGGGEARGGRPQVERQRQPVERPGGRPRRQRRRRPLSQVAPVEPPAQ